MPSPCLAPGRPRPPTQFRERPSRLSGRKAYSGILEVGYGDDEAAESPGAIFMNRNRCQHWAPWPDTSNLHGHVTPDPGAYAGDDWLKRAHE